MGNHCFQDAVYGGHSATVELLLDRGANIEAVDQRRRTALIYAAATCHSGIVQLLLDRGANIEAVDQYRRTALIQAAGSGHSETVQLLLDRGANIEAANQWGNTALISAAHGGYRKTFRLLASYGANAPVANVFCWKIRVSLSMIKKLRDRVERYCKVINCEFSLNNFFVAIEFLHLLNMRHNQMTAQICEKICFRLQLMHGIPSQNTQVCLSAMENQSAWMLALIFSGKNKCIAKKPTLSGIMNFTNIRRCFIQFCGIPIFDRDKHKQVRAPQKVPSLSILCGAAIDSQRMVKRLHKKQIIAAVTPTLVAASIAACLFAAIPHLGIIAILPAVLVLITGIATSITALLVMKCAHMQQQAALLGHANVVKSDVGLYFGKASPPDSAQY